MHNNMETHKLTLKSAPQNMKVIKVVNLKRFTPESLPLRSQVIESNNSSIINFNTNSQIIKSKHIHKQTIRGCNIMKDDYQNTGDEEVVFNKLCNHQDATQNNTSKRKVQLKSCLHTTEDLEHLTEHTERTLVKVGDTFDSRESFRQYLYDNAKRWHYYYVCRNSKKRIIEYNCMCMAYSLKLKEVVIRRRKKRITACPCKIRLTVDESTKQVLVYYVCNHHDHDLTEAAFVHCPHAKYLPQQVKDEFLDLAYLGLDIDLIQKYILSLVGLTIKRKDIWSYAYKFKRKIIERSLTADRNKYMKDLISRIRATYKDTPNIPSDANLVGDFVYISANELWNTEEKEATSFNKKNNNTPIDTATIKDDLRKNVEEPEDSGLKNVVSADYIDISDTVIVQYIDEKGILCDQDGSPVTNSSAIMQFIYNYEYMVPEANVKVEQFLEEGTVFSELVESINEQVNPFDWDSIQELNPVIERTSQVYNESRFNETTDLVLIDDEIAQELSVNTTEIEHGIEDISSDTLHNKAMENFHKSLSPSLKGPALYAEIENFKKYYFVDHQYIKYGGENCKNQQNMKSKEKAHTGYGPAISFADSVSEEYIKAPEVVQYPTYIKYCSGHEDLLQLTGPDTIQAGAKFLMHEVFITYINERANRWFFYYSMVESGKSPEYYVYKCVYGKHRVSKNAYRAKGLRKRVKRTTQCPCQIRLRRLEADPEHLTVLYSCNHHDHALDEQLFTAQPHSRRLPDHLKEEVKDLLTLGVSFDVLRKHVTSETGLQIYAKYFHNVRVKMRRDNENRQFTDERLRVLNKKIRDLEAIYGSKSKQNSQNQNKKRRRSTQTVQKEDRFTQAGSDEVATQTQDYFELDRMDDIAQEVDIVEGDSPTSLLTKRSRLETRLQNISAHEEILLKVKKLQQSVRSEE